MTNHCYTSIILRSCMVPNHENQKTTSPAQAWHAHDCPKVLQLLQSTTTGLTEAEANKRLAQEGLNEFSQTNTTGFLSRLANAVCSPLTLVLLGACGITILLQKFVDALVIALALLIAVSVSLYQEGRASNAFTRLASSQVTRAIVRRDDRRHEVNATKLAVGDIIELQAGQQVPADARLLLTKQCTINEAALTGEWLPVPKHNDKLPVGTHIAERSNMAYKGTFVAGGYATGVVVAVGDDTEVGAIANNLQKIDETKTPLQHEMYKVSLIMMYVIGFLVVSLFVFGLLVGQNTQTMALMAVAIAVAAIPEGLPAAITIILAVGMEALLKRGGLARSLLAAETLGSTTYVLTDKTGTLTQAKMAVTSVVTSAGETLPASKWSEQVAVKNFFNISLSATDAFFDDTTDGSVARGEPVERAILEAATKLGLGENTPTYHSQRVDYLAFTSENRFSAAVVPKGKGHILCVNGAPELLLERATHTLGKTGQPVLLTDKTREQLNAQIEQETKAGKRLVATGYVPDCRPTIATGTTDRALARLVFVGILIFADPVREGVKEAIAQVRSAGTRVLLVTGDNPETALAIARQVGIAGEQETALTGSEIEALDDTELLTAISHVHVFARVLPKQKLRLAEVLQKAGEIVAMTGDGINAAPALRRANIGIATGSGTQVAQDASDLVLVNDSFTTIYSAIKEGRRIIANVRKAVGYLLSTGLSEIALVMTALALGSTTLPITAVQILWANIIEEGLMSVAFAFEPGEKGAMRRRPQDIHEEGILSPAMLGFLALVGIVLSGLTVSLYLYLRSLNSLSDEELRSAMFLSVAADSLFIAFAFRSLSVPLWRISLFDNRFFIGAFFISCLTLFGALSIPFLREVLDYTDLPVNIVGLVFGVSALGLALVEVGKWLFFERRA